MRGRIAEREPRLGKSPDIAGNGKSEQLGSRGKPKYSTADTHRRGIMARKRFGKKKENREPQHERLIDLGKPSM